MTHYRLRSLLLCSALLPLAAFADDPPLAPCTAGDTRTAVPVWQPTIGDDGYITTEPAQQAGQIVYIRGSYRPSPDLACDDATLHPLARRNTDDTPGGLSVNLKGNTHALDGTCTFDGFYRNEEVPGMHQGWIETYFGAVSAGEVTSDSHCLAEAID